MKLYLLDFYCHHDGFELARKVLVEAKNSHHAKEIAEYNLSTWYDINEPAKKEDGIYWFDTQSGKAGTSLIELKAIPQKEAQVLAKYLMTLKEI